MLATSREPVDVQGEVTWPLSTLSLADTESSAGAMTAATQLFVDRAVAAVPTLDLGVEQLALVNQICASVDGLPLAIELAAARVRSFGLSSIAEQVRSDPSRLSRMGRRRPDHRHDLFESIEWSYRLLTPREQDLHRSLSVLPGSIPLTAAAAVTDSSVLDVAEGLLALSHRSLLQPERDGDAGGGGSTFRQLATVRAHAQRRLVESGGQQLALGRRDTWVSQLLAERPRLGFADAPQWYDRLEESYPTVRASLERAARGEADGELVVRGAALTFFWYFRSRLAEGSRWLDAVHAAGILPAGSEAELYLRLRVVGSLFLRFQPDLARTLLSDTLRHAVAVGDASVITMAEVLAGVATSAWSCRAFDVVQSAATEFRRLAARSDDQHVDLFAAIVSLLAELPGPDLWRIRQRGEDLYGRARQLNNLFASWLTALVCCVVATEMRHPQDAIAWTVRVAELQLQLGPGGSKAFLEALANCLADTGDLVAAARLYASATTEARLGGVPWPSHPRTRRLFDRVREQLPGSTFAEAWRAGENLTPQDLAKLLPE